MKKYTTNYNILDSGTVISFNNESIYFDLAPDLKIFFSFLDEKENKEQRMDFNPISNNELEIKLINFNNSLGTGNTEPLQIANLNNKKVYLNYRVYSLDSKSNRTLHYTWYLEK